MNGLAGKVALVTGGSRGIGAAIVKRLAQEKARVYLTYRESENEAKALPAAGIFRCDVRDQASVEKVVEELLEREDRLDVLVNNAGVIRDGLFLTMSDEDWHEVLDTNLGSVYRFCKAVVQQMMMQGGGAIINLSSIVGEVGGSGQANYAASKGAINAFTKALASELAPKNITVNAIAPGMVNTDMSKAVRSAFGEKIKEKIPLGIFAEPEDIASAAAFLASSEGKYITGQVLTVDGGLTLLNRR